MLKHDEEEILKVLLRLQKEQDALKISGSFTDFPPKYQIVYKEILKRLEQNNYIADFEDIMAEDFVLSILPKALNYFGKKPAKNHEEKQEPEKTSQQTLQGHQKVLRVLNPEVMITELESQIQQNCTESDKECLIDILEEVKDLCGNLKKSPVIQSRANLTKKIAKFTEKYPWLYVKVARILGLTMLEIMAD